MPAKKFPALLCFLLLIVTSGVTQQPRLVLPAGHIRGVREAVFSPDYKQVLSRDRFEVPFLWDVRTGYLLATLQGHSDRISQAEYSWDGNLILTVGYDGLAILWNSRTVKPLLKIGGKTDKVSCAALTKNGDLLAAGMADKSVIVFDSRTGKKLFVFGKHEHEEIPGSIKFSRDENKIRTFAGSGAYYWDARNGQLLAKTKYDENEERHVLEFQNTPDDGFLSNSGDYWGFTPMKTNPGLKLNYEWEVNEIEVIDTVKGKRVSLLAGHTHLTRLLYFSPGGDTLFTEPFDRNYATSWSTATMQLKKTRLFRGITRPKNHYSGFENDHIYFNNDRSLALIAEEREFIIYNVRSNSRVPQFRRNKQLPAKVSFAAFSDDNTRLLTVISGDNYKAIVWDMATAKEITRLSYPGDALISHVCFSPNNKWAALFDRNGQVALYELPKSTPFKIIQTGKESSSIDPVTGGEISRDLSKIFFIDSWANFKVYDIKTGKQILSLREPGNYVVAAAFTPDSKGLLISTSGSLIKRIDLGSKKERYHFFPVDSTEYFTQTPEGYYQGSSAATKLLHYVTKDLKIITFEQLDVKYNRPDKVLQAIGNTDTALIKSYRKAWEKRIKKLGMDTTTFRDGYSVPEADFVNRDNIEYEQKNGTLTLHIKGMDSTYKIDRFNVWVNESPVFGQRGVSVKKKNSNSLDTALTIRLSQGENRIETSITNVNGTESYRMPIYVNYTPAVRQKETTRFIGIGIDKFADPKNNLQYSSKDIRDLAMMLKQKYNDEIIIDTLFNENVTAEKVKALKQKLLATSVNDKVIVSYSGHGLLSKEYDYYLSTYFVNFDKPEENGLPYDELENLLDSIPARKKLMLIDACHSGEVDKEEMIRITSAADTLKIKGTRGGAPTFTGKTTLGMKNSFELMQSLFVNVGKSTGATIISAAAGTQFALERGDLKNGVFTYSILELINKYPTIKISDLKKMVGERVEQLTNGLQRPTSRNEVVVCDWDL